jgi:hypothetical protein
MEAYLLVVNILWNSNESEEVSNSTILMNLRSATLPIFKAVKKGILKNTVFWNVFRRNTLPHLKGRRVSQAGSQLEAGNKQRLRKNT